MGIDASLLKQGENILSASVHRLPEGGNPAVYFDFLLSGYREFDFTKVPYLMHPSSDGITISWELSKKGDCTLYLLEPERLAVIPFHMLKDQNFHISIEALKADHQYQYQISCTADGKQFKVMHIIFSMVVEENKISFWLYGDSRSHSDIHEELAR